MKRILIIEDNVWGHHLEYMSHLYHYILEQDEYELVFVVPHTFDSVKHLMIDKENIHAIIDYMSDEEYEEFHKGNYFTASWRKCKVLRKYIIKHQINECFLITLVYYLPLLPLFLPKNCKASGIIYRIYYYDWNNLDFFRKIKDVLEFFVLAKSNKIKNTFLLNDKAATAYSNKFFKTKRFSYLPDPINLPNPSSKNLKFDLKIDTNQRVFLHCGALARRKGTLIILETINKMSKEELDRNVFIFAGQVYSDIKREFYLLKDKLVNKNAQIIVFDEFCSYNHLVDLINISDAILVPYANVSSSSGIIGYAAKLNIPVIGPQKGLIGKIIRRYKLGVTIKEITPESLYKEIIKTRIPHGNGIKYTKQNTIKEFCQTIFNNLMKK